MSDYAGAVIDMEEALASETTSGRRLQLKRELAQMELRKISVHDPENRNSDSISPSFTTSSTGIVGLLEICVVIGNHNLVPPSDWFMLFLPL